MADYTADRRDARESLKEAGAIVALSWTPAPTSNAPDASLPEPVTVRAWGVQLEYSANKQGTQADSLIQAGDKQILLAALIDDGEEVLPEPPPECACIAPDGIEYVVKLVKPLAPAGVAVMYDLNIRRG